MLDYFLEIEGVRGDSNADGYEGQIEVTDWSWSQTANISSESGAASERRLAVDPMRISKWADRATPRLMLACANGEQFERVILRCIRNVPIRTDVLRITLTEAEISSYAVNGPASNVVKDQPPNVDRPREEIGFSFRRIEFETTELRPDGTLAGFIRTGWDTRLNEPC